MGLLALLTLSIYGHRHRRESRASGGLNIEKARPLWPFRIVKKSPWACLLFNLNGLDPMLSLDTTGHVLFLHTMWPSSIVKAFWQGTDSRPVSSTFYSPPEATWLGNAPLLKNKARVPHHLNCQRELKGNISIRKGSIWCNMYIYNKSHTETLTLPQT